MINTYIPGSVPGKPKFMVGTANPPQPKEEPPRQADPDLPRAVNYQADYSGCGYWRMSWPEQLLTSYQHMIVHGLTCMVRDKAFYGNIKSVRLQRQANDAQLDFYRVLRAMADERGFRLIYEIDDVVMSEDIPDYNRYKFAFDDKKIRNNVIEMMKMSDEISVTNNFMRDYYIDKCGNKNVSVIPNYPPKFWLDRYYDEDLISRNYDRHVKKRKKPRILYAGSGAHFDVDNKVNQLDDFAHVRSVVRKTSNKFQWVFIGAYPPPLHDLVQTGKIEFHPWVSLYDLPKLIHSLKINCMVAPLIDNNFNRCKSDIKFVEACAYGIPAVCQDMITYQNAMHKFTTGDDMIDQINTIVKDKPQYMTVCRKMRQHIETRWLEHPDNLGKYKELYCTSFGSSERKHLK